MAALAVIKVGIILIPALCANSASKTFNSAPESKRAYAGTLISKIGSLGERNFCTVPVNKLTG